ncbi:MAG: hypothetical protein JAY85_15000 [Candidatus Thiodiazotropha weberae]|uniref:Metallo-beta-lactamase domain-containing protein n=1 Tax=Candidatus Thiodiazotropha endoloripes TaxID=1818881 RepID=A0A1E2USS3_9GAMM|nr:hypothetical protein [Candidatus Thiodiazotropha endoloripes]MCG7899748.1 hypothetical protein [Candidatus Thiodiazotropha weberae]MCG7901275.1 hypothetical protein [Candidatus Thiodiazotropha weberae]MCG7916049.1 hypothetical protein [Candidatus Thiodiazotropha weberae]ODB84925.1 hypothetical protein A3194_14285 [Candidatus Thiodiazotropha endoloripes]ODB86661.1 hypothetical protein A3195_13825 [Candidatus Thiodiazotropha endoloripes]
MDQFPPALQHGEIEEVFPDIFFVSGSMETVLQDIEWKFSRNMTIVRDGSRLIIINSVRLSDDGLAELDRLGKVTDVIRLGSLHGRDDPFYVDRYGAEYWAMPGMEHETGLKATSTLSVDAPLPISNASLFSFRTTQIPEGILHIDRANGILIACDALQNWQHPDQYFSESSTELMQSMGFFTPANLGPVWVQRATPEGEDFARLKALSFKHALCGHGDPLRDTAFEDYCETFKRMFGI